MRRPLCLFFCAALCLSLAACGEKAPAAFDPAADAQALLDASGVFG